MVNGESPVCAGTLCPGIIFDDAHASVPAPVPKAWLPVMSRQPTANSVIILRGECLRCNKNKSYNRTTSFKIKPTAFPQEFSHPLWIHYNITITYPSLTRFNINFGFGQHPWCFGRLTLSHLHCNCN